MSRRARPHRRRARASRLVRQLPRRRQHDPPRPDSPSRSPRAHILSSIGTKYAIVFPLPVGARAHTSRPPQRRAGRPRAASPSAASSLARHHRARDGVPHAERAPRREGVLSPRVVARVVAVVVAHRAPRAEMAPPPPPRARGGAVRVSPRVSESHFTSHERVDRRSLTGGTRRGFGLRDDDDGDDATHTAAISDRERRRERTRGRRATTRRRTRR